MRAPTAGEAAALSAPAGTDGDALVPLAGGGAALRPGIAHASLAVAVRGDDGRVAVSHDLPAQRAGETPKGDANAR
jgi:hypothetical protein